MQDQWRLDNDPFDSARKYLDEHGAKSCISILEDVIGQPGTQALAFQVKDLVREWAPHTQELALDSTCECRVFSIVKLIFTKQL
jgi:hypothetical protein